MQDESYYIIMKTKETELTYKIKENEKQEFCPFTD